MKLRKLKRWGDGAGERISQSEQVKREQSLGDHECDWLKQSRDEDH